MGSGGPGVRPCCGWTACPLQGRPGRRGGRLVHPAHVCPWPLALGGHSLCAGGVFAKAVFACGWWPVPGRRVGTKPGTSSCFRTAPEGRPCPESRRGPTTASRQGPLPVPALCPPAASRLLLSGAALGRPPSCQLLPLVWDTGSCQLADTQRLESSALLTVREPGRSQRVRGMSLGGAGVSGAARPCSTCCWRVVAWARGSSAHAPTGLCVPSDGRAEASRGRRSLVQARFPLSRGGR